MSTNTHEPIKEKKKYRTNQGKKKAATDKYSYQNHLKPCIQATP